MTPEEIRLIIEAVRAGAFSPQGNPRSGGRDTGYLSVGQAIKLDTDRQRRRGFPEVIYCESKTAEEIAASMKGLFRQHGLAFGTRCPRETAERALDILGHGRYDPVSRTLTVGAALPRRTTVETAVIAAGTSDRPVAEEACMTLDVLGAPVARIYDVGVAGLHRLLAQAPAIEKAGILIVVAGMEGALPSVVGGLFRQPLIAVPTSVGYGAAMGGFAALLGMLTSCAGGITVVNIDNGFGAAMAALTIIQAIEENRGMGARAKVTT